MNFRNLNGRNGKEYPTYSVVDAVCEITSGLRVVYLEFSNEDTIPLFVLYNDFNEGFIRFDLDPSLILVDREMQVER